MPSSTPPTGFCSIRLERQAYGPLITVTFNPDVGDRFGDRTMSLVDVDSAAALVIEFLNAWVRDHHKPGQ